MHFSEADIEDSDNILNVLLMGESGVGKSTFINSFANYINSKTFEEATKTKTLILIPTRVTVYDENSMEDRNIIVGSDDNEKQDIGSSATQSVKTYLFPVENENMLLRLIDTPGIGDTGGVNKDDENCEGILAYLAGLKKLNAICLLMKPTNDRNTILFSYCVRRILSQLHKSASQNMVFVFTNTKGSDYRPGSTFPILKKMADDIARQPPHVKIPTTKDNVFCLDNECLKQLLAIEHGVDIGTRTMNSCKISWEVSCEEIVRFITYIRSLKPHNVKQTVCINNTRELILQLSKPLSEVCQFLQENIVELQKKEKDAQKKDQTIEELKANLYKPGLDLEVVNLDHSVMVCTDSQCVESVQVGGTKKIMYKRRCHDPCLLGYLTYEVLGHWSLVTCSEMTVSFNPTCKHCDCSYKKHMVIYYETKLVQKQFVDDDVRTNIESEEKELEKINKIIKRITEEKKELEEEQEFIGTCTAKFACFLQNNCITSSYDNFKEYLHLSIEREKSRGKDANYPLIVNLTQILQRHKDLIKTLSDRKFTVDDQNINEESVYKDIEKLFKLKYSGAKIKAIFDARAACAKKGAKLNLKTILTDKIPNWFLKKMK